MADVKWIKIKVGMFDGESFKKIKRAKIGGESYRDKLTAVWFELMDFAGKCNHSGAFINSREIPYKTLDDIATMIDRDTEELNLCMAFFINEGMVEIVDDVYMLSNWLEYQNEAGLSKIREQNRVRQARFRDKQKELSNSNVTCNVTKALPSISSSNNLSNSLSNTGDYKGEKRHRYGQYKNVLLSDDDMEKLKEEFPADWEARIERMSEYCASSGKTYKNYLAALRNWARRDRKTKHEPINKTAEQHDGHIKDWMEEFL